MINKKIVLSVLVLGFLTVGAAGATWAYFQDSLTSTGNGVSTASVGMTINGVHTNVVGATISDVIPEGAAPGTIKPVSTESIVNTGSISSDVFAKVVLNSGTTIPADMTIYVNGKPMTPGSAISIQTGLAKSGTTSGDITYTFTETGGNQNDAEGKNVNFDVVYYIVPQGHTPV